MLPRVSFAKPTEFQTMDMWPRWHIQMPDVLVKVCWCASYSVIFYVCHNIICTTNPFQACFRMEILHLELHLTSSALFRSVRQSLAHHFPMHVAFLAIHLYYLPFRQIPTYSIQMEQTSHSAACLFANRSSLTCHRANNSAEPDPITSRPLGTLSVPEILENPLLFVRNVLGPFA